MVWARAKWVAAQVLARVLADPRGAGLARGALGRWPRVRGLVDDAASAGWHLVAMPSRHDVRALARQIEAMRRRVAEVEAELARLDGSALGRPSTVTEASAEEHRPAEAHGPRLRTPDGAKP